MAMAARRSCEGPEVQPDGGEQHGLVDALGVHVGQAGRRVRASGVSLSRGRNDDASEKRPPGVASVPSGTARISVPSTTTCS